MQRIILKTQAEIDTMRRGGAILAKLVQELVAMVEPGLPTIEFYRKAADLCQKYGVKSGTLGYKGYPASVCISINEELVHGIPRSNREVKPGDLVKIDMVIVSEEYYLDHAVSVLVSPGTEQAQRLLNVTKLATDTACGLARVGNTVGDLSHAMQSIVELAGFNVSYQMTGHGIGKSMHEGPEILCVGESGTGAKLQVGMVMAIETMSMIGKPELEIDKFDQWTARTLDGSLAAHFEHTVAVTKQGPLILTAE